MSKASVSDRAHLEFRAIAEINEFLNKNEVIQMYLEDVLESVQDVSEAMTSLEMEVYSQNMAAIKMKLLAKVIGVL